MRYPRKRKLASVLVFVTLALILLQVPFAYRAWKLRSMAARIRSSDTRASFTRSDDQREYVGLLHVHTSFTGEISRTYDEMLRAAADNNLDFVILTEHYSANFDTSAATLNGIHGSTLFIGGNEVNAVYDDRFLMVPGGPDAADYRLMPSVPVVDKIHAAGSIAVLAYPEKYGAWDAAFDGIEVANINTMLRQTNPLTAALDFIWSGHVDRSLMIERLVSSPDSNLRRFDEIAAGRKIFLTGGTDAHSAIGFHLLGDELGYHLASVKIDPYTEIFRLVRLHVLSHQPLDRAVLLAALKKGSFFVGFDVLGDSRGFAFTANGGEKGSGMGSEIPFEPGIGFKATTPLPARIVLLCNGDKVAEVRDSTELTATGLSPGAYRVAAYREDLGDDLKDKPWILSNPIFVR